MNRKDTLEAAIKCVCQDRQDQHGAPENTFAHIADLWEMYLVHKYKLRDCAIFIRPEDVAWMMVLFKVARSAANPSNTDNAIDAAGYAALALELTYGAPQEAGEQAPTAERHASMQQLRRELFQTELPAP